MVDLYAIVRRLTGHELISPKDARLLTEAVDGLIDKIGSKDARIAELEAEVQRLTKERDYWQSQHDERTRQLGQADAEALSRTGAVKVTEAMVEAASDQISEGIGAYLRKFADSDAAKQARYWLHKMPDAEWNGMARLLAEEAIGAALKAAMEAGR